MKRSYVKNKSSRKSFTRNAGANNTHPLNLKAAPMRGGFRL